MALVVFTGGARSGKSRAAQELARQRQLDGIDVVVSVFARHDPADLEMAERISRHRADRPEGFETLEVTDVLSWLSDVPADSLLLVDCLGTMVGLVIAEVWDAHTGDQLEDAERTLPAGVAEGVERIVDRLVAGIIGRTGDTIVVTNEVGAGIVPEYASARLFRDVVGRANRSLVREADAAYLAVCGRMLDLHDLDTTPHWPTD